MAATADFGSDLARTYAAAVNPAAEAAASEAVAAASLASTTAAPASPTGGDDANPSDSTGAHAAHPQLQALRKIDALSEKLQKEGKLLEALQCMEKSLILRGHIFGLDSVEVFRACKAVGEMCNFLALSFLSQDLFDVTLELLQKAEVLTEKHKAVRAVTYNNLACYYRKRGKLRTALNYCRKALGIEAKMQENVKSADTHLNMCTILSELKRHEKAIVHARIALKLLLLELFGNFDQLQKQEQQQSELGPTEHELIATGQGPVVEQHASSVAELRARLPPDRVAVLAIAYHNLAVQQEFLRRYAESLSSYEKATKVVTTHLGPAHPLVHSLTESFHQAQRKMEAKLRGGQQQQQGGATMAAKGKKQQASTPSKTKPAAAAAAAAQPLSDGEYEEAGAAEAEAGFTSE